MQRRTVGAGLAYHRPGRRIRTRSPAGGGNRRNRLCGGVDGGRRQGHLRRRQRPNGQDRSQSRSPQDPARRVLRGKATRRKRHGTSAIISTPSSITTAASTRCRACLGTTCPAMALTARCPIVIRQHGLCLRYFSSWFRVRSAIRESGELLGGVEHGHPPSAARSQADALMLPDRQSRFTIAIARESARIPRARRSIFDRLCYGQNAGLHSSPKRKAAL